MAATHITPQRLRNKINHYNEKKRKQIGVKFNFDFGTKVSLIKSTLTLIITLVRRSAYCLCENNCRSNYDKSNHTFFKTGESLHQFVDRLTVYAKITAGQRMIKVMIIVIILSFKTGESLRQFVDRLTVYAKITAGQRMIKVMIIVIILSFKTGESLHQFGPLIYSSIG